MINPSGYLQIGQRLKTPPQADEAAKFLRPHRRRPVSTHELLDSGIRRNDALR